MKNKNIPSQYCLTLAFCLYGAAGASATDYTSYTNNSNLILASGDTLTVSSGNVDISYGGASTAAATLDASLATSVNFNIGSLRIGTRSDPTSSATSTIDGRLNLGLDNTITATTGVSIGGGGHIVTGILTTAANSNTVIYTPVMDIGTGMRTSSPTPNFTIGSGASLTIEGINGGRVVLTVGEERQASSSINWSSVGNMNLSGGQASLKLSSLVVGSSVFASGENGSATGTVTLSSNVSNQLDISGAGSVVQIGVSAGNQTTGTLTIGNLGSNSAITSTNNGTAILVGNRTGTGDVVTGNLNLNGGTVTITTTGAAIAGGSNATSNLNLDGGVTLKAGASSTNWIQNLDTAVINSGGATIHTNGNNIGFSQVFTGAGGLTKAGAGTLTFSTVQGYGGATNVTGGTLAVTGSGSINSSSGITVSSGATFAYNSSVALTKAVGLSGNTTSNRAVLGGSGPIGVSVTLDNLGDVLSPGNSPGIQEYTVAQNWNSFSYDWEVNDFSAVTGLTAGSDFDQITIAGALNLSGSSYILNLFSLTALNEAGTVPNFSETNRTWDILTATGGISNFNSSEWVINKDGFLNNELGTWSLGQTGNSLVLSYNVVPEPGAALLGGLGMLVLLRRRRE